jgi:uncharacterized protein (TIGR03437 family)
MLRFRAPVALALAFYLPLDAATFTVGQGAPDSSITSAFVYAWGRGAFSRLVADPSDAVTKFGTAGLIQHFPSISNSAVTLALVKPDSTDTANVMQVLASMYAYYSTLAVSTVGYPTDDTLACPALKSAGNTLDSCVWQPFTNNYALFVYAQPVFTGGGVNFATRDPFYTKWSTFGGVSGLGPTTSDETTVTSQYGSKATFQTFDQGAIYNITSGTLSGRLLAVKEPVYDLYLAQGAQSAAMGLPVTEELALANGMIQQTFEGGAIQYDPKTGIPVLLPAVSSILVNPPGPLHLNGGDTVTVTATLFASDSSMLTNRSVSWNSTNGQVVQVIANGSSATLKAVGSGTASVTASSGGKTSAPIVVTVTSVCCQVGEGAPTAAIQQAFVNAVARDKLTVQTPVASPVARVGNGYAQQLGSYLVTVADGSATAYVMTGSILAVYQGMGGPAGSLGYPLADATAAGRQNFQNGALAGSPVFWVTGAVLAKWASVGYETGVAGSPIAAAAAFQTFTGTSGILQSFQNAVIVNPAVGKLAGSAFVVSGTVLAAYNAQNAAAGDLGAPTDDEHAVGTLRQQDFEGGSISYAPGSAATVTSAPRVPSVSATPASVIPGLPAHLVLGGFQNSATVRVSVTGHPDFVVTVANGAYVWDTLAPSASGTVTIKAVDTASGASAQASFTVSSAVATLSIVSGDQQTGAPGAALGSPLIVVVKDQNGDPVPNQTVTLAASPGGVVSPTTVVTGANGQASASWRMPMSEGVALATATAGKSVVTFSANSKAFSLTNFPSLSQNVDGTLGNGPDLIKDKGALLTAVASILRYHQMRGELPQPNGLADVAGLNQFLKSFCVAGTQTCDGFLALGSGTQQTVNLWRARAFAVNSVDVRAETAISQDMLIARIRDLVVSGSPVLVELVLAIPHPAQFIPTIYGAHFVVATGIGADGSIAISDPLQRTSSLNEYLNQFMSGQFTVAGGIAAIVRLVPQPPAATEFLVSAANVQLSVSSLVGACGTVLPMIAYPVVFPLTPPVGGDVLSFAACDGMRDLYELDIGRTGPAHGVFTDLGSSGQQIVLDGSAFTANLLTRGSQGWTLVPLQTSFSAAGVINPASGTAQVAPGGFVSIYGTGFVNTAGVFPPNPNSLTINGETATVVAGMPFLLNGIVPLDVAPGQALFNVGTQHGSAAATITISPVAPAIFSINLTQAAITNQDNSLNTPANPEMRGNAIVVYTTGLGAVSTSNGLSRAVVPVSAVIGGVEVPAAFAGLTPGVPGLYQANIVLPASLPPGLALPLYLKQGSVVSNTVIVAVE